MAYNYAEDKKSKCRALAIEAAKDMPEFFKGYLMAKANSTEPSSLLSYTYDLIPFVTWWYEYIKKELGGRSLQEMTAEEMAKATPADINEYLFTLNGTQTNKTMARKCTAISSLFAYMVSYGMIENNPMDKVERPHVKKDLRIIRLENDETRELIQAIQNGWDSMSEHQRKYLEHTKDRDLTIVSLLLSTGIRVSECVGLDIDDIFLKTHQMQITRKGGKKQTLALSDEMTAMLSTYIVSRLKAEPDNPKDKRALFLSTRNTRLCSASIENIVKKYTEALCLGKHITPHKLRKTYGTNLYTQTRDIYLVASALGHESVNTTTQHYVPSREEDLQDVRNMIQLDVSLKENEDGK